MRLVLVGAAGLVVAGVVVTLTGGNRTTAWVLLVAGLLYALAYLWANRRPRRR
jgi:drug/metabolite transporter (DMT)-like permease